MMMDEGYLFSWDDRKGFRPFYLGAHAGWDLWVTPFSRNHSLERILVITITTKSTLSVCFETFLVVREENRNWAFRKKMLRTLLTTTCIVLLAQCRGQQRGGFSGPVHPLPLRAPVVEYKRHQPPSGLPTPQPLIAIPVSSSLQIGRSFDGFTSQDEEIDFEFLAKQLKSKFQTVRDFNLYPS